MSVILPDLKYLLLPVFFETLIYGIYLCLAAASLLVLAARGLRGSRARQVLFCVTFAMFSASTGSIISDIMSRLRLDQNGASIENNAQTVNSESDIPQVVFVRVNYVLSDSIVVWRCWSLCARSIWTRMVLSVCMIGTIVAAIVSGALVIRDDITGVAELGPNTLVLLVPLVVTNICATSLVAHKAWLHRRLIRENLGRETRKTQVEKVFILLMESGSIYCLLGIIALISGLGKLSSASGAGLGTAVLSSLQPHLAGIYPTAVVLLVTLEKTHKSTFQSDQGSSSYVHESRVASMRFARPSALGSVGHFNLSRQHISTQSSAASVRVQLETTTETDLGVGIEAKK